MEINKDKKRKNKTKTKENNIKAHDSLFKELLENKEEFKDYAKDFLGYNIEEIDLELQNKEYRLKTIGKTKYIDMVYEIKKESAYIIVEHQSTIDWKMPERIAEDCIAIVESRSVDGKAPRIIANVLSTANKKWNVPNTIIEEGSKKYRIPKQTYPKYVIVNNYDYSIEELLEKRTGIGIWMAFEKVKTKEEINYIVEKVKEKSLNKKEKEAIKLIIKYIEQIIPELTKTYKEEEIEEIKIKMKEIIGEGGDIMPNFEKALKRIIKENFEAREKARAEGRAEGRTEGRENTILQIVRKMLKINMKDEEIINIMDITKEELEKLKLQLA